jgi:hypothetical protein
MERNGFNPSPHETSASETGDSSDKEDSSSSKKKKKSSVLEVPTAEKSVEAVKKEQAAERAKELLDKLVGIGQEKEAAPALKKEKQHKVDGGAEGKTGEEADEKPKETAGESAEYASEEAESAEHEDEKLSEEEQAEVVAAYAPARIAELEAGRDEAEDPADAAAREADIAYLKEVLEGGLDSEAPEVTEEDAEQDMDLVEASDAPRLKTEDEPDELPADEAIALEHEEKTHFDPVTPPVTPTQTGGSAAGGAGKGGGRGAATGTGSAGGGGTGGGHGTGAGAGGARGARGARGVIPPIHPANAPFMYGGPTGPNYNLSPAAATAPTAREYTPDYRQNPNASYLLVGGMVGYFIGRRRGRITTEKKMKVVQRKLEKQVEAIQSTVAQKELEVQKLAREQYWQQQTTKRTERMEPTAQPELVPAAAAAAAAKTAERVSAAAERVPVQNRENPFVGVPSSPILERAPDQRAPAIRAERLTPTGVMREARPMQREAQPRTSPELPKQIQELSTEQLMVASEKIKVGNTNLKRIYEARLVSESGLKRLVHEFIENKDIRRGLAREFLAKELSYERDPRFRDLLPPAARGTATSTATTATSESDHDEKVHSKSAQAAKEAEAKAAKKAAQDKEQKQAIPNGLLAALTLLALGLAAYAVLLSLSR